ncbi:Mitochondrial ornithine transporter 2 [Intoshia linei]|uniref:Mitochondrial ornithine transporter 2 n=1 Tax=Intoshia linei TaxID=1819745 RepID=A0A177AVX2_9BILA|nr:Mitochondrial ornithine transporter 2 [Intoshia linei]
MQSFPSNYKSAYDCFQKTYTKEGFFRGLYAGTIPSLVSQVAENSILFFSYGLCQKLVCKIRKTEPSNMTILHKATSGSMAAFAATFVICPTELIKCRLQGLQEISEKQNKLKPSIADQQCGTAGMIMAGGLGGVSLWVVIFPIDVVKSRIQLSITKTNPVNLALRILKNEGLFALYKGLGPTLLRTFPASGALFLAYENTKHYISLLFKN